AQPRERALLDERRPFVACGVMRGKGERLIVTADRTEGDLGSKDLNTRVAAKARELLETGESGIHEIAARSIFFEVLVPPPQLVVLGAGDDARPLVRFAADVGLDIGTDGAEQVALAVIAEILAVRSGRRARSLRERRAAIHAPSD